VTGVRWLAEVHVALRGGIADPEGQTIGSALRSLGYESVREVRSGKLMRIAFEADDHAAAEAGSPRCAGASSQIR
jgi:phosphoribosylformylglycinamidine synthase PurS subunit